MTTDDSPTTRRSFLNSLCCLGATALAGCTATAAVPRMQAPRAPSADPYYVAMYGAMPQERFPVPAIDISKVDPRFYRRLVPDPTGERPGTIVVDTSTFYLYLVQPDGMAMRYGVGLGRAGFEWSGRATIAWKREWPTWTPPDSMIGRQPELARWSASNGGMPPGLDNPLGARALYIFQNGVDTLYRIHGSPEYWSIGKAVSSGCVRLMNQDIIDLYGRVPPGTPILVT